jgi:hypothetical protein
MGSGAMTKLSKIIAIAALLLPGIASAQFYNIFGPVTGLMVGNVNSPQTTLATSANVTATWVGTNCATGAVLELNGNCIPAVVLADSLADLSYAFGPGALVGANLSTALKGYVVAFGEDAVGGAGAGYNPGAVNAEITAIGWRTGSSLTTGTFDTYIGTGVGRSETTGTNNTGVGVDTQGLSVGDTSCVGVGVGAEKTGTCSTSVALGNSVLIGQASSAYSANVGVGSNVLSSASLTTASNETAIGANALANEQNGNYNLAAGTNAGQACTTCQHMVILAPTSSAAVCGTGSNDIIIGYLQDCLAAGTSGEIDIGGLLFYNMASVSAPAVTACGTTPAIDTHANNRSGTVTVGTGAAASCTITFAGGGYTTWNHCRVTSQASIAAFAYSYTLTVITVTATSLLTDKIDYDCDGF